MEPWDPPGKGTWSFDATRVTKPFTGMLRELFAYGLAEGLHDATARYGLLLDSIDVKYVNGFPYLQPRPVGVPAGGRPPPKLVFKIVARVHPAIRRRLAAARDLFERAPWREEVRAWDERVKPAAIALHTAIDAVDIASLGDAALAEHVERVFQHGLAMIKQDHSYNLTYLVPLGDFLAHASDWTQASEVELFGLFRGSSQISSGDSAERRRLLLALGADSAARAILGSGRDANAIVTELRAREGEVGEAMNAWMVVFGNAIAHGLDMTIPCAREEPRVLVDALRRALEAPRAATTESTKLAEVRARVPEAERDRFDVLFADARASFHIRDERHVYGAIPTLGFLRRAALEVGRRLAARDVLPRADLAVHASRDEILEWLAGRGPSAADMEARALAHATLDAKQAPPTLGGTPSPPPPHDWLPTDGARRAARAVAICLRANEHQPEARDTETIHGLGVSGGVYEGIARVCANASDLAKVKPGDILVAPTTTPAINVVLALLGAIVTDRGGTLCHAAIVTREYGIPGVVGTTHATSRIADGARIRVDGTTGTVTVIA